MRYLDGACKGQEYGCVQTTNEPVNIYMSYNLDIQMVDLQVYPLQYNEAGGRAEREYADREERDV